MWSVETFIVLSAERAEPVSSFWPTVIGAAVGGAVSLATTLLVERRRDRAATNEHRRKLVAAARLAARVIELELSDVESVLRVALQRQPFAWPPSPGFELPGRAWREQSAALGAIVPDAIWDQVALPYSSFEYARLLGAVNVSTAQTLLEQVAAATVALRGWSSSASVQTSFPRE
jgi:hypothetical protein